jgi:hypothetical protein
MITINTTITDEQGALLAKHFSIAQFDDGNNLMTKVTRRLELGDMKTTLIKGITRAQTVAEVRTVIAAAKTT